MRDEKSTAVGLLSCRMTAVAPVVALGVTGPTGSSLVLPPLPAALGG